MLFFGYCSASEWGEDGFEMFYEEDFDQWKWEKEHKEFLDEVGVGIGFHCSGECSMRYIYINETHTSASRGYPEDVTEIVHLATPQNKKEWLDRLYKFCEKFNLTFNVPPKFWICSYWG